MKTFNGFLYHTDKVVVNPYERPNANNYFDFTMDKEFKLAKKVWESNNIEVEIMGNVYEIEWIKGSNIAYFKTYDAGEGDYNYREFKEAQPCTYKMSGDKAVVLTLKT